MKFDSIPSNRLYGDLAWLWPLISTPGEYEEEGRVWRDLIVSKLGPGRHRLLELGCGGGNLLSQLKAHFDTTAVDLSEKMLAHSLKLNPGVEHHVGDMREIRLHKEFDAVVIHDAIGYLLNEDDIRRTFATAAAHLNPGGVLAAGPDWYKETFHGPWVESQTHEDGVIEVTYVSYAFDRDPADTIMEDLMIYMIREGSRLRIEHDRHVMGLFSINTWLSLMEEAGFKALRYDCETNGDPRQACLLVGK